MEELYMDKVYIKWGTEAEKGDGRNANLAELVELPQLIALHLCILDASALPKEKFFDNERLETYKIVVGEKLFYMLERSLRVLHLKLEEQSQLYEYGFQGLIKEAEALYLGTIPGVKYIVSQLDTDGFPQLKKLGIKRNDEVQQIIESKVGEIQPRSVFKSLERLDLQSLQSLERICSGRFTPESFGQLRRISVSRCHKLKNVLSYTVARKLEEIKVEICSVMMEIVYHESEDHVANYDEIEFSCLCSLTLTSLPNLTQFSSSELETTNFRASSSNTPNGPLFNEKVAFPSLEVLELSSMDFSKLWPNGIPSTSFTQNLRELYVAYCKNLKYLFPFAIVGSFMQLEHLDISYCAMMEEIVKEWPGSSGKLLLPKLRSLRLEHLQSLKRFCGGDCNMECESSSEIETESCHQLKTFNSKTNEQTLFNEKIAFPRLEILDVTSCESLKYLLSYEMAGSLLQLESLKLNKCKVMEEVVVIKEAHEVRSLIDISFPRLKYLHLDDLPMLKRFSTDCIKWSFPSLLELHIYNIFDDKEVPYLGILSNMIFKDLQVLKIVGCKNMMYLLPFAKAEGLKQLKKLLVWECDVMEHVINKAIGEDGRLKKISFPKLESLDIYDLPKLESFCEGADFIECPSLLELKLHKCEKLRTFVPNSASTTPALTEDEQQAEVRESVTQQPLFNENVVFSNLEELHICSCGEDVNEIWPHQSSTLPFTKLKVLYLMEHSHLMHLFENPENIQFMLQTSQTLETLIVKNCPGLKTIAMSSYFSFKNLTDVSIFRCHGMTSLFDSSLARSLEQLTRMSIDECDQLTHVIRTNHTLEDELAESDEIVFRRLEILAFHHLPSLKSFHGGKNNMLEFPRLEILILSECPEMSIFSHGTVNTPKLSKSIIGMLYYWPSGPYVHDVQSWFGSLENVGPVEELILVGDLNRRIRMLWDEKNDPHIALQWLFSETADRPNFEEIIDDKESTASSSE